MSRLVLVLAAAALAVAWAAYHTPLAALALTVAGICG